MNMEMESGTVEPTLPDGTSLDAPIEPPSWEALGIDETLKQTLLEIGFVLPMEVQRRVVPHMMAKKDIMVQSRTGSGKTGAFGIPFANGLLDGEQHHVQALVLAPTRELALQVAQECEKIAAKKLRVIPVYGGAPMGKQIEQLNQGAHVVAGTPGRVLDHLRRGTLKLDGLKVLVLDEADEMLSMGFLEEITEIIKRCPTERQTVLFSATLPEDIERIGSRYMRAPEKLQLSADFVGVHEIKHTYYMVSGMGRTRDLLRVLSVEKPESAIIFCNTREDTGLVAEFLRKNGLDAEAISSDLVQKDRERVMNRMKAKDLHYLVATDIAARGIDISNLTHVINYTFPESAEVYVHRTGRTGRAGKSGLAISLISPRELGNFYMLKLTYKIRPEERELPPPVAVAQPAEPEAPALPPVDEVQLETQRESSELIELARRLGAGEPAERWRKLARRIAAADDGERLVALLLEQHDSKAKANARPRQEPSRESSPRQDSAPRPASPRESSPRESSPREPSPRDTSTREPSPRAAAPRQEGDEDGAPSGRRRRRRRERPERSERTATPARMPETIDASDGKEFWEAWVDSKSEPAATAPEPKRDEPRRDEPRREREKTPDVPLAEGQVRLYLNLGRRDSAREPEIEALLRDAGVSVAAMELRNSHTYLIVAEDGADAVIAALAGKKFGERDIVCERARAK